MFLSRPRLSGPGLVTRTSRGEYARVPPSRPVRYFTFCLCLLLFCLLFFSLCPFVGVETAATLSVGFSAGWPSVSRPDGRVPLAAWRGLILHARLGLRLSSVEWSAIHRVPAPHLFPAPSGALCALTPRGCDCLLGGLSQCFLSTSGTGLRARRLAAQMRCAVAGCSVRSVKIETPQASLK